MKTPALDIRLLPERCRSEASITDTMTFVIGRGATTSLACNEPLLTIPLRGCLRVGTRHRDVPLRPGAALVTDGPVELRPGSRNALWVAVLASDRAWRSALGPLVTAGVRAVPVVGLQPEPNALRRQMLRLLRHRLRVGSGSPPLQDERFFAALADCVQRQNTVIARCPGRTHAQRARVHARLQNARLFMLEQCDRDIAIADIASVAGYSPSHFMRTFHTALGETAYTFLTRARLARARALLTTSSLAVAEVAFAAGFEDRGTFSRQFRRHFGITAADLRRRHARLQRTVAAMPNPIEHGRAVSRTAAVMDRRCPGAMHA
jgi:AraC family transcriptional regulator